jgi:modification methylase
MQSKHSLLTDIWEIRPEMKSKHPAPFPLEIPLRCIYSICDNEINKVIIDPYMGSGTTAVACKFLNQNYIGIDCSQEYIDIANDRINNYELEKDVFEEEISKHIVKETFAERKAKGKWKNKV